MSSPVTFKASTEKRVVLAFRLQSVLVILAILALGGSGVFLTTTAFQIAVLYLASNALLMFIPAKFYQTKALIGLIVVVDVLFVSLCIRFSGNLASDIYLLYFLAIFMAALSRDLRTTVVAAVIISVVYLWVSVSTLGIAVTLTSGFLLRIPLFFVTAFFAGFLANQARQREKQHQKAKQIATQLEEQLEHEIKREEEVTSRYDNLSRQHQELISNIKTGVLVTDEHGVITNFNAEAERLIGLKAAEVLGHRTSDFQELSPITANLRDTLRTSSPNACAEFECSIRLKQGQLMTVGVSTTSMFGENANITGATIAMRDLTELDSLRERINRSERLACLGGTSLCMARRMREQLKSIVSLASIQCERTDTSESLHQTAEAILSEADTIDTSILETIQFVRRDLSSAEPMEFNEVISLSVSGLSREMERLSIRVTLDLDQYLPIVLGSPLQLRQVIIQILINAMEAVEKDGEIRIRTRAENGYVLCDIEDNGPGVSEKMRDRLFEPLSTSKANGAGIGLFICKRLLDEHDGFIELLKSSGDGSLFQIRLPVLSSENATAERPILDEAAA